MATEVEIKLRIPSELIAGRIMKDSRVCECMITDFEKTEMDATYYDNAAGEMSKMHCSLRIRRENGVTVACCKMSQSIEDALFSRNEWQTRAENWDEAIPKLIELGAPEKLLTLGELLPRCRIVFTRTAAPLKLPDGSTIELAVDEGYLYAEEKREELRELELELLTGKQDGLVIMGEYLEKKYSLPKEYSSKYARALRLIRSRPR